MRTILARSLIFVVPALTAACPAAEPLRWKFAAGDTSSYVTALKIDMSVSAKTGDVQVATEQIMDITWRIEEVTPDGDAKIRQHVERIRLKMSLTGSETVAYDTAVGDIPKGLATKFTRILDAMTDGDFVITMTPRGEVIAAQAPQKLLEELKFSPDPNAMGDLSTPDGIRGLIMQSLITLPESGLEPGNAWQSQAKMKNPLGGVDPQVVTTYTFAGTKDVDGQPFAAIKMSPKVMDATDQEGQYQLEVKDQKSDGEFLFDRDRGRLHSSHLQQTIQVKMKTQATWLNATINQSTDMKLKPEKGE